jgi:hypothetical protein
MIADALEIQWFLWKSMVAKEVTGFHGSMADTKS